MLPGKGGAGDSLYGTSHVRVQNRRILREARMDSNRMVNGERLTEPSHDFQRKEVATSIVFKVCNIDKLSDPTGCAGYKTVQW